MNKNDSKEKATARDTPKGLLLRLWKSAVRQIYKYTQSLVPFQENELEREVHKDLPIILANKKADEQRKNQIKNIRKKKHQKQKDQQLTR